MTALAANTALTIENREAQSRHTGVILTSSVMYHHALAVRTAAGKIKPLAAETTTTFVGLVEIENPDNTTAGITGDGTLRAEMINDIDVIMPCITAITVGDEGGAAYGLDDNTITTVATAHPEVGTISRFIATNSVAVRLGKKALAKGA